MARRDSLQIVARSPQAPLRGNNPFATCWTRPGALPFHFESGETAVDLVARLAAKDWRGAIIGPHGCGKSTLLESLKQALVAAGRRVHAIALHDGEHRLPHDAFEGWETAKTVIIIDGYEQLGWWERLRLARRCRRAQVGLVVTAHRPTRIPMLVRLTPGRELIEQLVAELCAEVSTPITKEDVAASHACHGSNVREIFFDLYDRHERRRRRAVVI